ncbi:MAG: hypothetical protein AB1726_11130 [Planctomycetota bacterium]
MKRHFEFRLSRLRRVREIDEQVARAVWTAAEAESREATEMLEEARSAVHQARADLSSVLDPAARAALDPRRVLLSLTSIETMIEGVRKRRESALTLRNQADQLAVAWREREVERRGLAELEERARTRHRTALERGENAAIDEQNIAREARRRQRARPPEGKEERTPPLQSDSSAENRNADRPPVSTRPLPFE